MSVERYLRQMKLDGFGAAGQDKLHKARVLVIGAGGLGSPCIQYLAGAGVGTIGIVDHDVVNVSNLHRQVIHITERVGMNKAVSASEFVHKLNDTVRCEVIPSAVMPETITELISSYDFIISAVDSFEIKFLINDACVLAGKAFSHGGATGWQGESMTYVPGCGPCYRCVAESIPENGTVPTSAEVGILGMNAGIIGTIQAMEAVKYLTGSGDLLTGKFFTIDCRTMKCRTIRISESNDACRVCGRKRDITSVYENRAEYRCD